jgi:uncharacterized delta-60 repeat protein
MMRRAVLIAAIAVVVLVSYALSAHAAAGDLDPSFSLDGEATTDFSSPVDEGNGVAIQPNGKIVVAGLKGGTEWDFALARYNRDGTLDTSFDSDGKVITNFGAYVDQAFDVAIQPDGKIVAAGWSDNDFALARYNPDGSLDTTFDSDGKVTTDFGSTVDMALDVAIQPNGDIVAAGWNNHDFALARYNPDGSLDASFDSDGKVTTDFGSATDQAAGMDILPDGDIVAAGYSNQGGTGYDFAVARYNPDGSLDSGFDSDGKVTTDFGSASDQAGGMDIQPNGDIVAGGYSNQGATGYDFALARYNPDGSLDSTFDSDGKVTTDFGSASDQAGGAGSGLVIQPNRKIVAAGYSNQGATGNDFALARYNPDGSLDTSFSLDGKVTTDFGLLSDVAVDATIQPNGNIVAAGYSSQGATGEDFAVARYLGR